MAKRHKAPCHPLCCISQLSDLYTILGDRLYRAKSRKTQGEIVAMRVMIGELIDGHYAVKIAPEAPGLH